MFGTVKLIRDQQETIDALERECNHISSVNVNLRAEAMKAKHECSHLSDVNDKLLAEVEGLIAVNNKLKVQLKAKNKELHRARCEAINYKRAAQKNAAMFNNLMATYANTEGENKDLMATVSGLSGRLDVYERCLGKIEQDKGNEQDKEENNE